MKYRLKAITPRGTFSTQWHKYSSEELLKAKDMIDRALEKALAFNIDDKHLGNVRFGKKIIDESVFVLEESSELR